MCPQAPHFRAMSIIYQIVNFKHGRTSTHRDNSKTQNFYCFAPSSPWDSSFGTLDTENKRKIVRVSRNATNAIFIPNSNEFYLAACQIPQSSSTHRHYVHYPSQWATEVGRGWQGGYIQVTIANGCGQDSCDSIYTHNEVLSVQIMRISHKKIYRKSARLERYCWFQSCSQLEKQTLHFLF